MGLEKMFKVLVLGGSMLGGCGGETVVTKDHINPLVKADASDAADDSAVIADDAATSHTDAEAGVSSWLSWA